MKKLIIIILLFSFFQIEPASADRSPIDELCNLYNGQNNENVCILESGEKCDPLDVGFMLNNKEILPCNQYATISCAKHGESVSLNECCEGLKRTIKKEYYNENCEQRLSVGGTVEVCLNCGNRICDDAHESVCNCPEDCQKSIFEKFIIWLKNIFL